MAVLARAGNLFLSLLRLMFTGCLGEQGRRGQIPHFIVPEWGTPVRVEFRLVTRPRDSNLKIDERATNDIKIPHTRGI